MEDTTDAQEPKEEKSKAPSEQKPWWQIFFGWILIAALIAAFWSYLNRKKTKEVQVEKRVLYKMYDIDKKTLAKWISLFCCNEGFKFDYYKNKRKLSKSEFDKIVAILGEPSDETPVMKKSQIITLTDASYEVIRNSIIKYPDKVGISIDIYDALSLFPPSISKKLVKHFE